LPEPHPPPLRRAPSSLPPLAWRRRDRFLRRRAGLSLLRPTLTLRDRSEAAPPLPRGAALHLAPGPSNAQPAVELHLGGQRSRADVGGPSPGIAAHAGAPPNGHDRMDRAELPSQRREVPQGKGPVPSRPINRGAGARRTSGGEVEQ